MHHWLCLLPYMHIDTCSYREQSVHMPVFLPANARLIFQTVSATLCGSEITPWPNVKINNPERS